MTKQEQIEWLKSKANEIRKDILISLAESGSGHLGGSLGLTDVFTALYFYRMRYKADLPLWEERDRLILSIGHVAPAYYTTLAHAGYFPKEELNGLRKLGSRLQGHPGRDHGLPGLELSAGSLGQGLSVATGMALAAKHSDKNHKIVCIHGDGELQEGSVWEAMMSAGHYKLNNLICIIDRNFKQIDGDTEDVMSLEPLNSKLESFGWQVLECNGNSMEEITATLDKAWAATNRPIAIIAETKMGNGVQSIENDHNWHGKAPSKEELVNFLNELR